MRSIFGNLKVWAGLLVVAGAMSTEGAVPTVSVSELNKSGTAEGSVVLTLKTDGEEPSSLLFDLKYDGTTLTVTPPTSVLVPSDVSSGTASAFSDDFIVDAASVGGGTLAPGMNSGTLRVVISSSKKDAVLKDGTTLRVPVRMTNAAQTISSGFPVTVASASSELNGGSFGSVVVGPSARFNGVASGGTVNLATQSSVGLDVETLKGASVTVSEVKYFSNGNELASVSGGPTSKAWMPTGSGMWMVYARVRFSDGSTVETNPVDFTVSGATNAVVTGLYTGAVMDSGSLRTTQSTGAVRISTSGVSPHGSYSLRLTLEGRSYSAAGRFGANSTASADIRAVVGGSQRTLRVRLEQGMVGSDDWVSGMVTDGTIASSGSVSGGILLSKFVADRVVWAKGTKEYNAANNGQPGRYHSVLTAQNLGTESVYGTTVMNVSAMGIASGQLTMFDGTRAVCSGYLSKKGVLQPYASVGRGTGFLAGSLDFSDQGLPGWMGGDVTWRRNALSLVDLGVEGGTFTSRGGSEPVFAVKSGSGNVLVKVSGGGLASFELLGTYSSNTVVFPPTPSGNPNQLRASLNSKQGTFSGAFKPVGDSLSLTFAGLVLQGRSRGDATFVRAGTLGLVRVTPVP
jgi:hypothetical protein